MGITYRWEKIQEKLNELLGGLFNLQTLSLKGAANRF
jgi:hypothetical protein